MASTTTSPPPGAMDPNERLEKGEKGLVFGVMAVLAVEMLFTIIAAGIRFSWLGLLWSAGSSVFVLCLANYLYAGNRTAYTIGSVWSAFQVVLSLIVLLVLAFQPGAETTTAHLALPVLWMAAVKLAAYVLCSISLFLAPPVRDFLDVQRGGELAPENPLAPTGIVVTFSDEQKAVVGSLGALLSCAGIVLVILGALEGLLAFRDFIALARSGGGAVLETLALWLFIKFLPAVATIATGILMFKPAGAAKLVGAHGADLSYLVNVLMKLRGFFSCLTILIGIKALGALLGVPVF